MSKKARLSRDQKRKQKLAKRQSREPLRQSPAYTGNRYKSEEFARPLFRTEGAIYEGYVMSDREMTDDAVELELQEIIAALRVKSASELIYAKEREDRPPGYAAFRILSTWQLLLEERELPARDDLIGILRTILASLEVWRSRSASSRGYLNYLEGFMNKMGVTVQRVTEEGDVIDARPDELYEVGEMWLAGSPEARHRFTALSNEYLEQGKSQRVIDVCQRLQGSIGSPARPEFPILTELSIRAQKAQQKLTGPQFAPGLKNFISRLAGW
jgi:hypothetical protein